ncbi:MAG: type III toxin-antitoxin system ToxN/AbiQ family toxin [Clostridia bacterium]|nr:type III toxin-antitoxin system ToxN/AbiQ family toxin [Clostridia bacterium]
MEEFKLYSVSDEYIDYLRKTEPNVYGNKVGMRRHTRKYLGVAITIGDFSYFIPLSSAKDSDYVIKDGRRIIRKSIVPIIRITAKNLRGELELKATIRISHMIPVPQSELELYDVKGETDTKYKDLVQSEIIFIRKNADDIRKKAELLYKQKCSGVDIGYVKAALDYQALEKLCSAFSKH